METETPKIMYSIDQGMNNDQVPSSIEYKEMRMYNEKCR